MFQNIQGEKLNRGRAKVRFFHIGAAKNDKTIRKKYVLRIKLSIRIISKYNENEMSFYNIKALQSNYFDEELDRITQALEIRNAKKLNKHYKIKEID